ncbi:hypothetical protein EV361DRAFT_867949 [Lentinula raphanica]|nr:hypothetical protein F5880DRAFT_1505174 [Lentinula raphanica]KAJ3972120.1 hypothetical protein EV361DRAFT_867949 [Lentinula raphanica]
MRFRVICSLFAVILLGVVSVHASPLPPDTQHLIQIRKRESHRPISIQPGVWDDNSKRWLEREAWPELSLSSSAQYGCIGYIERKREAFVRDPEHIIYRKLSPKFFSEPLSKKVLHNFNTKMDEYFNVVKNIEKLQEMTNCPPIKDRNAYFKAAMTYGCMLGFIQWGDLSIILEEIAEIIHTLPLPSAENPPPASAGNSPAHIHPATVNRMPPTGPGLAPHIAQAPPASNRPSATSSDFSGQVVNHPDPDAISKQTAVDKPNAAPSSSTSSYLAHILNPE